MTTEENTAPQVPIVENFHDRWRKHVDAVEKANQINKTPVFEALAAAGITQVSVHFDGCGDSGQIEDILVWKGSERVEAPDTKVHLLHATWASADMVPAEEPLKQAIETLCYGYLEQKHVGWENNDGAFGEFTFDVAVGTIEFELSTRYTATETDVYEL